MIHHTKGIITVESRCASNITNLVTTNHKSDEQEPQNHQFVQEVADRANQSTL